MPKEETVAGYDVVSVLGHGAQSMIFAVKDPKDSQMYAIKRIIKKSPSDQRFIDQMANEFNVSLQVDHPNLRKCLEMKKKRSLFSVQEAYLIMEYVAGENLAQKKSAEIVELLRIFLIAADAMGAIHEAGYLHADMKPNNIIVDEKGNVKIIDLGQSCEIGTVKTRIQGTPDYIAPEQVRRKPLTVQTDMFNYAASLYWCVTNKHIPTAIPDEELTSKEDRTLFPPTYHRSDVPEMLDNLLMDCLEVNPMRRPETWEDMRARLNLVYLRLEREKKSGGAKKPGSGAARPENANE